MTNFPNVRPALAATLTTRGYTALTPVQEEVIAPALEIADLLVSAQTGSGKTVAFGLALAPTLLGESESFTQTKNPLAVVITPTRELAMQVKRELEWLYKEANARLVTCVGGMDMRDERKALGRGVHIVVGTPGRLCDHIKRGSLDMSNLKAVVLDEADEMLKMGFREELELILTSAPSERRTLMFSATVPKTIIGMTKKYQKNAVRINTASEAKQHLDIKYRALNVARSDEENAIINVLRYYDAKNAIVFCDTRIAVNRMTSRFNNRGFSVVSLSGELSQNERSHALQSLRDGRAKVCIATDVASRGLDLPDLELVVHASIPKNAEVLLHRSGRTGRAGRKGVSVLIVPNAGRRRVERLFNTAKIKAEWAAPPSADDVFNRDNERLLAELALSPPTTEKETEIVERLLKDQSHEQIAAAYLRQYCATHTAP
ncbi:MAG: DEAD/DEAH box helicase, partial [Robiginitomaculum sp.]|nr:DEAD/DEAH box helicase [Robiginitomaculum sp.]